MSRLRFFPLLMVAAVACSEATPVGPYPISEPIDDGFETVSGMVLSESEFLTSQGRVLTLIGPHTKLLRDLIGAEIRVRATADELDSPRFWVVEFTVLSVDGLPALDGTLEIGSHGFAVRDASGQVISIGELPESLAQHSGKRVWLTMRDGEPVRFGVLAAPVDRTVAPTPRAPQSTRPR
jgi:hypothetical protein